MGVDPRSTRRLSDAGPRGRQPGIAAGGRLAAPTHLVRHPPDTTGVKRVKGHPGGGLNDLGYPGQGTQASRVTPGTHALLHLSRYEYQLSVVEPGAPPGQRRPSPWRRSPASGPPAAHALALIPSSRATSAWTALPERLPRLLEASFEPGEVRPGCHPDRRP
jgi:hypothetical protein